ncbi:ribonuclease P protein component [Marinobacterium aestuariivivens]|uniref:Ribonuclease P protein component n=1 Tax=Marinobacterium aestuariivivens TaxID=1698799 RepID=A0ABW1ZZN9_9GAMM
MKRNRIRRIIRESFRLNQHKLPPVDLVILARKGLDELEPEELHQLMNKCWSRLKHKAKKANPQR